MIYLVLELKEKKHTFTKVEVFKIQVLQRIKPKLAMAHGGPEWIPPDPCAKPAHEHRRLPPRSPFREPVVRWQAFAAMPDQAAPRGRPPPLAAPPFPRVRSTATLREAVPFKAVTSSPDLSLASPPPSCLPFTSRPPLPCRSRNSGSHDRPGRGRAGGRRRARAPPPGMGGGGVDPHEEGQRRHLRCALSLDRRQAGPLLLRRHPLPQEPAWGTLPRARLPSRWTERNAVAACCCRSAGWFDPGNVLLYNAGVAEAARPGQGGRPQHDRDVHILECTRAWAWQGKGHIFRISDGRVGSQPQQN